MTPDKTATSNTAPTGIAGQGIDSIACVLSEGRLRAGTIDRRPDESGIGLLKGYRRCKRARNTPMPHLPGSPPAPWRPSR